MIRSVILLILLNVEIWPYLCLCCVCMSMSLQRKLSSLILNGKTHDVLLPVTEGSFLTLINQCL